MLYIFEFTILDIHLMFGCYIHWSQWESFYWAGWTRL